MRLRGLSTPHVVAALLLCSGCFSSEDVPESPCYLMDYSQESGNNSVDESYSYDRHNKLIFVYRTSQTGSSYTSADLEYLYDKNGRVTSIENMYDASGTKLTYDAQGKTTSLIWTNSNSIQYFKHEYTYNANGQMTKLQTYNLVNNTLTKSTYFTFEYANKDTKNYTKRASFSSTDVAQSVLTFTYDNKKNPLIVINPFDPQHTPNNITKYVSSNAAGTSSITYNYTYTYSAKGFPLTCTVSTGSGNPATYTFSYSNCSR